MNETSESVQSCIAFTLRAIAVRDYCHAIDLFRQCCEKVPSLPCSRDGYDLLRGGLREHFESLWPYLESMAQSSSPECVAAGAKLVCIAALTNSAAQRMADDAVAGSQSQRLAAAQIASANLDVTELRSWCEAQLLRFFNDPDKDVRRAAGHCFSQIEAEPIESFAELIAAYCRSAAFEDNSHSLLSTLERSTDKLPGTSATKRDNEPAVHFLSKRNCRGCVQRIRE